MKRSLFRPFTGTLAAIFTAIAIVTGSFAAAPAAAAYAVTQPDELTYNTGHRDEPCTSLSEQAVAYYSGDHSYEILSELSGDALKKALFEIFHNIEGISPPELKTPVPLVPQVPLSCPSATGPFGKGALAGDACG